MRSRMLAVFVGATLAFGGATTARAVATPTAHVSKTCSRGYTHAVIGGAQKCLRRGEFCSTAYKKQYPRYGFRCVSGRLR